MFHLTEFWYRPYSTPDAEGESFDETVLVWIQSEEKDAEDKIAVLRKMVKNIRWMSKKVSCDNIVLHSFAHIAESKAPRELASEIISEVRSRLLERGFHVHVVPEGLNEFRMHVKGPAIAKVFKSF